MFVCTVYSDIGQYSLTKCMHTCTNTHTHTCIQYLHTTAHVKANRNPFVLQNECKSLVNGHVSLYHLSTGTATEPALDNLSNRITETSTVPQI